VGWYGCDVFDVDGGTFGTLVGPVGVGVAWLSSFVREVKRLEVIVGGDK
jgi:hypothetical protein